MISFASWNSYSTFARCVMRERRYIHSEEVLAFLEALVATSASRMVSIPAGKGFFRAQRGCAEEEDQYAGKVPKPYPPERMKPRADQASEGRVNPKGIPCLYVATSPETALSEVRPWLGSIVSIGYFVTNRPLKIVDCSGDERPFSLGWMFGDKLSREEKEKAVWGFINNAFSVPVASEDDRAHYVPTQVIAECLKTAGYDGVAYRSSFVDEGHNIALFDITAADITACEIHEVTKLRYSHKPIDNPRYYSLI
ncbi:RES family NAD+ phosphorylase [Telmatospirillum sp. J64-1]|uniref:RES family NAD+ phosphorylase n=1 Tax=Telmatospirillum sp. J64-1 TaxID=2502183 RepID=UPI00163D9CFF|nr:RES family NAD+ phosphorylase [Telmatospirillum sp. J64-1]